MTDTADRVIERWADMFDEMMGLDDEAVDMVRQLLGSGHFGLREAVEKTERISSDEHLSCLERADLAAEVLAALLGEGETLKAEEQADG